MLQLSKEISGTVKLPGSKSLSNHILLAALAEMTSPPKNYYFYTKQSIERGKLSYCGTTTLGNLLYNDDVRHMLAALRTLGLSVEDDSETNRAVVVGSGGEFRRERDLRRFSFSLEVQGCDAALDRCRWRCKGTEPDQMAVKSSAFAEIQRRILIAESALREKEEENDILHRRLRQYENRWSGYEQKMRSMEEVWQKQMSSLQSSLCIARKSLAMDNTGRSSDASVEQGRYSNSYHTRAKSQEENGARSRSHLTEREMSASLNVIGRLAEEFEQRSQVFADDAKFLVEVKSGQAEASLNPERELRRLKQSFDGWKRDYNMRLQEAKAVIHKFESDEANSDKVKKKWWGRLNSSKVI